MTGHGQRGVALLTVLLLVALVSGLVVAALDDVRFGVRGASNAQAIAQARWHALGAEVVARERIRLLQAAPPAVATADDSAPLVLPVEDGTVSVHLRDASTCFNLNSVVEGAGEQWQRRQAGVDRYLALLAAAETPPATATMLADALVDWIDSDQVRSPAGAEDRDYAGYRTGGTLLAEPSELRAIAGYGEAIYVRLRPLVCALPDPMPLVVNVNALDAGHGPMLAMLTAGALDAAAGRRVLAARPPRGWQDADAFWALPALAGVDPGARGAISVRGNLHALRVEVELGDALLEMSALLHADAAGDARLLARRWSEPE